MNSKIKPIIMAVVFIVCLSMIIIGQRNVGYEGLAIEFVGLIGLLADLFVYNRDHK